MILHLDMKELFKEAKEDLVNPLVIISTKNQIVPKEICWKTENSMEKGEENMQFK